MVLEPNCLPGCLLWSEENAAFKANCKLSACTCKNLSQTYFIMMSLGRPHREDNGLSSGAGIQKKLYCLYQHHPRTLEHVTGPYAHGKHPCPLGAFSWGDVMRRTMVWALPWGPRGTLLSEVHVPWSSEDTRTCHWPRCCLQAPLSFGSPLMGRPHGEDNGLSFATRIQEEPHCLM